MGPEPRCVAAPTPEPTAAFMKGVELPPVAKCSHFALSPFNMKLLSDGPDIPPELLAAQEKGEVIFICGAGVSMTIGLPSFRELVDAVYVALGENWRLHPAEREIMERNGRLSGQYDRVLRCLERRLTAAGTAQADRLRARLRDAIREKLQPPQVEKDDLNVHAALLDLSRDAESTIRLVTTNFDTLFERAWPRPGAAPSFAGPAMPQPRTTGCAGVLHLHGRLADKLLGLDETDLVLTSAEFGDAYLRSGWASRYIYDLARAYTIVLVGYQADDPPMRYMLEVLEADRERYSDLRRVYAFANVDNDEALTRALWESKGVVPILHEIDADGSYGPLYRTILQWRKYAQDPTAWRREQLQRLVEGDPHATKATVERAAELLRHGDASQLLSELNPPPAWLPLLRQQRIFDGGRASPGAWVSARLDDPDMIRAVVAHPAFDERTVWLIEQALDQKRGKLAPVRASAWELLLSAKKPRPDIDHDLSWYRLLPRIRAGEVGYEARETVTNLLRPRLRVNQAFRFRDELAGPQSDEAANESLDSFMRIDFEPSERAVVDEIVDAWPREEAPLAKLLQALERTLLDSLEQAEDVGFTVGYDRSDRGVPSVARHEQNRYRSGFYPIVRVMADMWERLAEVAPERALRLSRSWRQAPFILVKRLALFAATNSIHPADDLATAIMDLDDYDFWLSGAQVELMRGLVARWDEFKPEARANIESRIRAGLPRELFETDTFDEERWQSVCDHAIYRRLSRLKAAGKRLSATSITLLREIAERHPQWRPSSGDRDDFHIWSETRVGPEGDVSLLKNVPDEKLVEEALRIESEQSFDQGELWRLFCSSDPDRAFRGLLAEAEKGIWSAYAWRSLLWAIGESFEGELKAEIADAILDMPGTALGELADTVVNWIRIHRAFLDGQPRDGDSRLWPLWDRLSHLVYCGSTPADPRAEDPLTEALNRPGGTLAWTLVDHLAAANPAPGAGLGDLEARFTQISRADGEAGLLGRVYFASTLSYLHAIAPDWTEAEMLPRFQEDHPEALAMWKANAYDRMGSAVLFNALKAPMLAILPRPELSDERAGSLSSRLLEVLVRHQAGAGLEYKLTPAEVRDLLTVGPARLREHIAWQLWHLQSDDVRGEDPMAAKGKRWRKLVGPIFERIWPLDGRLRTERASRHLVGMVMETGNAFPEAVDSVVDVLSPYELYSLQHTFRLETAHTELIERHPRAIVKLINALIDPSLHRVPRDLRELLDDCQYHDPEIIDDPTFLRLNGFRRLSGA